MLNLQTVQQVLSLQIIQEQIKVLLLKELLLVQEMEQMFQIGQQVGLVFNELVFLNLNLKADFIKSAFCFINDILIHYKN